MRKVLKDTESKIIVDELKYIPRNSTNNKKIEEILLKEQKSFCAYTDEYISRTDARDIEHFNPTLKGTPEDNYKNWFLVKSQWNKEKSTKWEKLQPVLHPTANDLEERIIYLDGDYFAKLDTDVEASNLIRLLKLDDQRLTDKRKKYIKRKKEEMAIYNQNPTTFFTILINDDACQVSYLRAIREEFGIDIWQILQ
ncbi:hypothetical protein GFS24_16315 [Chitinophaga sp. SYP-B3965]|uniref:HNH endonuclease domain-containing protein n=1 Tax=Chitinophaga sp. SYP-B3965 TaxID=2663120 RepID=UPI001299A38D|nr:HNH endonuclease domain-containing protein [Chitinophaga sp. SYP-B3965]MRG46688.1 hypothetical protein [Chitinophaga sp. SYP-B3965]